MKRAVGIGILLGSIVVCLILSQIGKISFLRLVPPQKPEPLPFLQYTLPNLRQYTYQTSQVTVEKQIADFPTYTSYLFSFQTLHKKMTGHLNVPKAVPAANGFPVIILVRGFIPIESYQTGSGTKPPPTVFAENAYVTLPPDFFRFE